MVECLRGAASGSFGAEADDVEKGAAVFEGEVGNQHLLAPEIEQGAGLDDHPVSSFSRSTNHCSALLFQVPMSR